MVTTADWGCGAEAAVDGAGPPTSVGASP